MAPWIFVLLEEKGNHIADMPCHLRVCNMNTCSPRREFVISMNARYPTHDPRLYKKEPRLDPQTSELKSQNQ